MEVVSKCKCCRLFPQCETQEHLFFRGEWAAVVWRIFTDEFQLGPVSQGDLEDWFSYIFQKRNAENPVVLYRKLIFSVSLWEIWRERCLYVFEESYKPSVKSILFRISDWKSRFQKLMVGFECSSRAAYLQSLSLKLQTKFVLKKRIETVKWTKPPSFCFKLNCDGSVSKDGVAGGGAVVRDDNGEFCAAASWYYGKGSILSAELMALRDGLSFLQDLHIDLHKVHVEVDSLALISCFKQNKIPDWGQRRNWKEILSKVHLVGSFSHIYREVNVVADLLAKRGCSTQRTSFFFMEHELPKKISGAIFWEKNDLVYVRRL